MLRCSRNDALAALDRTVLAQEEIARNPASHTGRFLAEVLARRPVKRAGEPAEAKPAKKARAKAAVRQAAE